MSTIALAVGSAGSRFIECRSPVDPMTGMCMLRGDRRGGAAVLLGGLAEPDDRRDVLGVPPAP